MLAPGGYTILNWPRLLPLRDMKAPSIGHQADGFLGAIKCESY